MPMFARRDGSGVYMRKPRRSGPTRDQLRNQRNELCLLLLEGGLPLRSDGRPSALTIADLSGIFSVSDTTMRSSLEAGRLVRLRLGR